MLREFFARTPPSCRRFLSLSLFSRPLPSFGLENYGDLDASDLTLHFSSSSVRSLTACPWPDQRLQTLDDQYVTLAACLFPPIPPRTLLAFTSWEAP